MYLKSLVLSPQSSKFYFLTFFTSMRASRPGRILPLSFFLCFLSLLGSLRGRMFERRVLNYFIPFCDLSIRGLTYPNQTLERTMMHCKIE